MFLISHRVESYNCIIKKNREFINILPSCDKSRLYKEICTDLAVPK